MEGLGLNCPDPLGIPNYPFHLSPIDSPVNDLPVTNPGSITWIFARRGNPSRILDLGVL